MRDVVTRFSGGGTYAGVINVAVQGLVDEAESAAEGEGSWWLIGCVIRSKTDGRFGGGRTAITAEIRTGEGLSAAVSWKPRRHVSVLIGDWKLQRGRATCRGGDYPCARSPRSCG